MNTVILTIGASASGKTSWAKNYVKIYPNAVIAERDAIRSMMGFPPVGDKHQEKTVTNIQRGIIETALLNGNDVVVPDTNLNKQFRKHLIKFIHEHGANVQLVIFDVPLDELRERTGLRPADERVPLDAVKRQFDSLQTQLKDGTLDTLEFPVQSYAPYKPAADRENAERVVTVDLDGTVANHFGVRSPYDYTKVGLDKPHEDITELVHNLSLHYKIIYVSGRESSCREDTINWIREHIDDTEPLLFMREAGDSRPDWVIKNEIYDREIIPNYDIAFSLDDRDQVVRHMRRRGIRVLQVAPGRF